MFGVGCALIVIGLMCHWTMQLCYLLTMYVLSYFWLVPYLILFADILQSLSHH